MVHSKISVSFAYQLPTGNWQTFFDEIILEEGDTPRDAFYEAKRTVEKFYYESNKAAEKHLSVNREEIIPDDQTDKEWEEVKSELGKIEFQEDGWEYVTNKGWHLNLEVKKIINNKPNKPALL